MPFSYQEQKQALLKRYAQTKETTKFPEALEQLEKHLREHGFDPTKERYIVGDFPGTKAEEPRKGDYPEPSDGISEAEYRYVEASLELSRQQMERGEVIDYEVMRDLAKEMYLGK